MTGATGQTGANVCAQLIERGDNVRALVRKPVEAVALAEIGVELIKGDISDSDDVSRAAKGPETPLLDNPPGDPYTVTKLGAFLEAHKRAPSPVTTC